MIEEFGGGVGVRSWASILDDKTREQAEQTALLPILTEPIALMADHQTTGGYPRIAEIASAEAAEPNLVTAVEVAGRRRHAAETATQAAELRRDTAQADRHAWAARRDALELALDEARARAGVERLAAVEGVMGTLLDLVDIDAGWEAAVETACGEALAAVVLDSVDSGRRALRVLADVINAACTRAVVVRSWKALMDSALGWNSSRPTTSTISDAAISTVIRALLSTMS